MQKEKRKKVIILGAVLACLVIVISIIVWPKIQSKRVESHINNARIELKQCNYGKAYDHFEKAIKIKHQGYEPEKLYIEALMLNLTDENMNRMIAIVGEIKSEQVFLQIIEELCEKDMEMAADLFKQYLKSHPSDQLQRTFDEGSAQPVVAQPKYEAGIYINPIQFELSDRANKFGQKIYVTTDGTEPTKESLVYNEKFDLMISDATTIKMKAYNLLGESTETVEYRYIIDESSLEEASYLVQMAKKHAESTSAGENIGCCTQEAKDALVKQIGAFELLLEQPLTTLRMDAEEERLMQLYSDFRASIIEKTDKNELVHQLEIATKLKDKISGGKYSQEMVQELEELNTLIKSAYEMKMNIRIHQEQIDEVVKKLTALNNKCDQKILELDVPKLGDADIINLLDSADRKRGYILREGYKDGIIETQQGSYSELKDEFNSPDKIKAYYRNFATENYYNNEWNMIQGYFKYIDGKYCVVLGDGTPIAYSEGIVVSKNYEGNRVSGSVSAPWFGEMTTVYYSFICESGIWKVDRMESY